MELWDILDENGEKTGDTVERGQPMREGEFHLIVQVWIRNSNGKYLITKRAPNKTLPNMWETTCGAAIVGEDSLRAALREVKEEIDIDLCPSKGRFLYRLKREKNQHHAFAHFADVWLFEQDVELAKVVYQVEEVCGAKWAMPTEIQASIESGEFANTFPYLQDLFYRAD